MVLTDTQLSLLGDCAPILTPEQKRLEDEL